MKRTVMIGLQTAVLAGLNSLAVAQTAAAIDQFDFGQALMRA
jgi:hypothetical protein